MQTISKEEKGLILSAPRQPFPLFQLKTMRQKLKFQEKYMK